MGECHKKHGTKVAYVYLWFHVEMLRTDKTIHDGRNQSTGYLQRVENENRCKSILICNC
jgi:hypothetical protein